MDLTALEDALLAAITKIVPQGVRVESYSGQLNMDLDKAAEQWPQIIGRFPAVFVAYGGAKQNPALAEQGGLEGLTLTWELIVCCKNLRGEAAARREDGGAYDLLVALREQLVGQELHADAYGLEFESDEALAIFPGSVIYRATYTHGLEWQREV